MELIWSEEDRMIEEFAKYFKVDKNPEFMKELNIYKKKHPEKSTDVKRKRFSYGSFT